MYSPVEEAPDFQTHSSHKLNVSPLIANSKRAPMDRPGLACKGQKIQLLTNYFQVHVRNAQDDFFNYNVSLSYYDSRPIDDGRIRRVVIGRLQQTFAAELGEKDLVYDGENCLFTVGPLPRNQLEFTIVLDEILLNKYVRSESPEGSVSPDEGSRKRLRRSHQSRSFKIKIIYTSKFPAAAITSALLGEQSESSEEALRVLDIILRRSATKQGFLLRQSHNMFDDIYDFRADDHGCSSFHYSFRVTQGGLSLNIDADQEDYGFLFSEKDREKDAGTEKQCFGSKVTEAQLHTDAISSPQSPTLEEKSRKKPTERMEVLSEALKANTFRDDPILRAAGISIESHCTQIEGRILSAPKLTLGEGKDVYPRNGRWSFNNQKLAEPVKIERWAIANFSAFHDALKLSQDLARCGQQKGIFIEEPYEVIQEDPEDKLAPPLCRVQKMFDKIKAKLPSIPQFLLCILPEKKNSNIYGPWKRMNLVEHGIITQCIVPVRVTDQYLINVLLKINVKLGGLNSLFDLKDSPSLTRISTVPTIILGMVVSHGSCSDSDKPSISAVVSSRQWPSISHYKASMRSQPPKIKLIDSLFKPVSETVDEGIIQELLLDFYFSSGEKKPEQMIIFRELERESQFNEVLNMELDQIIEACKFLDEKWRPKFTVIVMQKHPHTKFFQKESPDYVPPGTVVDNQICHPLYHDFYMYSEAGMAGTTSPTRYHVLFDEIGFTADDLQELVHSLSYIYQRSNKASHIVAPISYAHLAASQMRELVVFDEMCKNSTRNEQVPELPELHENVCSSMFYC